MYTYLGVAPELGEVVRRDADQLIIPVSNGEALNQDSDANAYMDWFRQNHNSIFMEDGTLITFDIEENSTGLLEISK